MGRLQELRKICPKKLRKPAGQGLQRPARNVVQLRVSNRMAAVLKGHSAAHIGCSSFIPIGGYRSEVIVHDAVLMQCLDLGKTGSEDGSLCNRLGGLELAEMKEARQSLELEGLQVGQVGESRSGIGAENAFGQFLSGQGEFCPSAALAWLDWPAVVVGALVVYLPLHGIASVADPEVQSWIKGQAREWLWSITVQEAVAMLRLRGFIWIELAWVFAVRLNAQLQPMHHARHSVKVAPTIEVQGKFDAGHFGWFSEWVKQRQRARNALKLVEGSGVSVMHAQDEACCDATSTSIYRLYVWARCEAENGVQRGLNVAKLCAALQRHGQLDPVDNGPRPERSAHTHRPAHFSAAPSDGMGGSSGIQCACMNSATCSGVAPLASIRSQRRIRPT